MNLKNIIAVSGLSGLYKLVSTKSNGLLVADMDTGKTKFCSLRLHQFTPMETVAIYTEDDTIDIVSVFRSILEKSETNPIPLASASHKELQTYFNIIIPDYDRDRVYHSDMKKVIKWYNFLFERGYITLETEAVEDKDTLESELNTKEEL